MPSPMHRGGKDARLDAVLLMTEGEERYDVLVAAVRKI